MEQAVGEDVTALGVGGELDLVHGDEIRLELARHGFDRAHIEARALRLDLLFARDQRDMARADPRHDLVVDLAGEEPQRQADNADVMGEHALDGEVGLAGIGRAEHGGDAAASGETCGLRG